MGKRIYRIPSAGDRFGNLTATGVRSRNASGRGTVECVCDCGRRLFLIPAILLSVKKKTQMSCGCLRPDSIARASERQHVGKKFNMLTILRRTRNQKSGRTLYVCKCDCGNEILEAVFHVMHGKKKNCGCRRGMRLADGESGLNRLYQQYQAKSLGKYRRSKYHRDLPFTLSKEQFKVLTNQPCFYCGVAPRYQIGGVNSKTHRSRYVYNGLDRVDNEQGYTLENVVPCCRICNVAKGAMSQSDFLTQVHMIAAKHPTGAPSTSSQCIPTSPLTGVRQDEQGAACLH